MSKPVWEEEWEVVTHIEEFFDVCTDGAWAGFQAKEAKDLPRARLASAAPDMARLLLKLEYAEAEHAYCRTCYGSGGTLPPQGGFTKGSGHKPDCEWLRVMKKAGVV